MADRYAFRLELRDKECRQILYDSPLSVEKLLEHAVFSAKAAGAVPPNSDPVAAVAPVYPEGAEQAYVTGFDVTVATEGNGPYTKRYAGTGAYAIHARMVANKLVTEGRLEAGATFNYLVSAVPSSLREEDSGCEAGDSKQLEATVESLAPPIVEARLADFGVKELQDVEFDVLVAKNVVDEFYKRAMKSIEGDANEEASMLIGYLAYDREVAAGARLFLVVTAEVPVPAKAATCTSFTFEENSHLLAQKVIELRGRPGEQIVGWAHSHPFCASCEQRSTCEQSSVFFSEADRVVQEAGHSSPHEVALVIGRDNRVADFTFKCYGWRDGAVVQERPFAVIED